MNHGLLAIGILAILVILAILAILVTLAVLRSRSESYKASRAKPAWVTRRERSEPVIVAVGDSMLSGEGGRWAGLRIPSRTDALGEHAGIECYGLIHEIKKSHDYWEALLAAGPL